MANVIEVIVLGKDQASGVLGKVGGAVSGLGSVAAGVATGGLALAAAAVVGLGAAAVGATIGVTKLAFAATEVEGTRRTFERLMYDLGGSAVATDALKEATRGMVSEADLWAASNKFLTMGLTENIDETAEMAEMATQLGMAMGTDATKSMEDFALMLANQSIPRLDTFGISSSVVRGRILELMEATEGLTREEAFKIAVMEQGRVAMEKVGEQSESATATTLRWKTTIADLKLGIGQAFVPALESIRGPVLELVDKYGPKVVEWANVAGKWLGEKIPEAIKVLEALWTKYWPEASGGVSKFWAAIKPALEWLEDTFKVFSEKYLPYAEEAWAILQAGWDDIVALYRTELEPALADLWKALGIGQDETDRVAGAFGTFMGILAKLEASGIIVLLKLGIEGLALAVKGVHVWILLARSAFEGIRSVMDNIQSKVDRVRDAFNNFRNALSGFELPWWLTPGSPTPLETGLAGIGKVLSEVQDMAIGGIAFGGMTLAGAGAGIGAGDGGGGVTTIHIINNFGPGSIRSDEDVLKVADATAQSLELRGIGPVL